MSKIEEFEVLGRMKWLKLSEAMIYARMSRNTLKRDIYAGDINAGKRGGSWIVDRESIDQFYKVEIHKLRVEIGLIDKKYL